ncbi:MAG: hypothetical protein WC675_04225 [Patescibacteria group bacterium]|jgi:hypothetical protein
MQETESKIIPGQSEGNGDSEISREEIAQYFSERPYLDQKHINALKQLPPREAFELLISARPEFFGAAINLMKEFPQPETIELLLELRQDPKYARDIHTIDWILFQFAHNPASSQEAIDTLKELGDPRAILETEAGKFEMATELTLDEVTSLVPALAKNRDWLSRCFKEGAVFTLRTDGNKLASVAVAHQRPDHILYLDYIYTADDKRKEGHAQDLLQYLLKHQVVLQCDLFRGDMLGEEMLNQLGFEHEGPGEKWVYRAK